MHISPFQWQNMYSSCFNKKGALLLRTTYALAAHFRIPERRNYKLGHRGANSI